MPDRDIEVTLTADEHRELAQWITNRRDESEIDREELDEECPGLMSGLDKLVEAFGG